MIRACRGPGSVLFTADDLLTEVHSLLIVLFIQPQFRLQRQNSGDRLIKAFPRNDSVSDSLTHIIHIFAVIDGKQEHIYSGRDTVRYRLLPLHRSHEARHMRIIRHDQAVKAQPVPKQSLQKLPGERGRKDLPVRKFWIQELAVGRTHNVSRHDCIRAESNQFPVYFPEGFIPLFHRTAIHGSYLMLIPEIFPVTREMFDGGGQIIPVDSLYITLCHTDDFIRIRTVGPGVGHRTQIVLVYIHDRREGPVESQRRPFPARDDAQLFGARITVSGRHLHLCSIIGPVADSPVSAPLEIRGDQKRDVRAILNNLCELV